jgi:hypothetical protein
MKKVARYLLIAIVAAIVGSAVAFVWAMQREVDISTPADRAKLVKTMTLGCKLRLPQVMTSANVTQALSPDQMNDICGCAVGRIIDTYAVDGKIKPSDVSEAESDATELACLNETAVQ